MIRRIVVAGLLAMALAGSGHAADLVDLRWGDFTPDLEGAMVPSDIVVSSQNGEMTLSMALKSLVANADGTKTEASSSFSGNFAVMQPDYIALPSLRVELEGLIIKTPGSTARIDVTIGSEQKTVEWKGDATLAERFKTSIIATVEKGQLPSPFPVAASVYVSKSRDGGAVLVSIDTIKLTAGDRKSVV